MWPSVSCQDISRDRDWMGASGRVTPCERWAGFVGLPRKTRARQIDLNRS